MNEADTNPEGGKETWDRKNEFLDWIASANSSAKAKAHREALTRKKEGVGGKRESNDSNQNISTPVAAAAEDTSQKEKKDLNQYDDDDANSTDFVVVPDEYVGPDLIND